MKTTNLKMSVEPETTIFEEEASVIKAVVIDTIDRTVATSGENLCEGSFLLYGKKDGDDKIQKILSFDFEDGPTKDYFTFDDEELHKISSREKAEEILKRCLTQQREDVSGSITYYWDSPLFLSLKTTYGRFGCACFGKNFYNKTSSFVYCAVTQAFACMGLEDEVLQKSCERILRNEADEYEETSDLIARIKDIFVKRELPELERWGSWHDESNSKLTLFFE